MQQLTGLDAAFLTFETANSTGHVGGLCVLDPSTAPEPLTLARLTEVLGERLPLVPVLRRKLLNVPLGLDQPYWIDDADSRVKILATALGDLRGIVRLGTGLARGTIRVPALGSPSPPGLRPPSGAASSGSGRHRQPAPVVSRISAVSASSSRVGIVQCPVRNIIASPDAARMPALRPAELHVVGLSRTRTRTRRLL